MQSGICSFEVITRIGQRGAITSEKRKLRMVGTGKKIPDRDASEIGIPARKYLNRGMGYFILLIDDLERDRRPQAREVFNRYRLALDKMLKEDQGERASIHFLVNMLEAYFFADAAAINSVLNPSTPLQDFEEDVESIGHPKNKLKRIWPGFDEVSDGGLVLDSLDIEHVLSRPETCASCLPIGFGTDSDRGLPSR
jgi:hypothetical protein